MKRLIATTVLLLAILVQVLGQTANKFSYQAVVRNSDGTVIANQEVELKVILVAVGAENTEMYSEVHTVTTSPQGIVNLVVGNGTGATGSLDNIVWADGNIDITIDIKLDPTDTDYVTLGSTRILAVPYALYAATGTPGEQGPQGEPGIPILWLGSLDAEPTEATLNQAYYNTVDKKSYVYDGEVWTTLAQDGADGIGILWKGNLDAEPTEAEVNWAYYNTVDKKSYIYNGTEWTLLTQDGEPGPVGPLVEGTAGQMLTHDGTTWIATGRVTLTDETLEVRAEPTHDPEQPIFAVYNSESKLAFAVYEKGTRVYVEEEAVKAGGSKGGFAVGGLSPTKAAKQEVTYMMIYPDSVRFNIIETPVKAGASKGGFAVGGLSPTKESTPTNDYFSLTYSEARFTVRDDAAKASKGGFAVGGLSPTKGGEYDYFMVNADSTYIKNTLSAAGDVIVSGNMSTGGVIGTIPLIDAEGNEYQTVRIGTQVWMKENLRTSIYNDLTAISTNDVATYNETLNTDTLQTFGKLYSMTAISNANLCPTGWGVPTDAEWTQLLMFVGGVNWSADPVATALKLAEAGTTGDGSGYWNDDGGANNLSGFSGRPGGAGEKSAEWMFWDMNNSGYFWGIGPLSDKSFYTLNTLTGITKGLAAPMSAYSVRCIKR